jgi:hypothetical protein
VSNHFLSRRKYHRRGRRNKTEGNIIPERFDIAFFIICLDNASIA